MTFFVLLVAMSTPNAKKFKAMSGSIHEAFGMTGMVNPNTFPMGSSAVLPHSGASSADGTPSDRKNDPASQKQADEVNYEVGEASEGSSGMESDGEKLKELLQNELGEGAMQLELMDDRIVIRVDDSGAFKSGSAELSPQFEVTLGKLAPMLKTMPGTFSVSGHTDDRPTKGKRFRSNWELSGARAAAVADFFTVNGLESARLVAQGYGDSRPLVPNDTDEGRAQNRRVEITIIRPLERIEGP
jgi:chemotaxis protein MotB